MIRAVAVKGVHLYPKVSRKGSLQTGYDFLLSESFTK
jgi:hypothetical protein